MQRAVTQVGRLVRSSLNNREDIPRLESGSDPASNRLDAIGFHDPNVETKSGAVFGKSFAEPPGSLPAAHLSSWAYRYIKNRMRSAGSDLLGKDRGHELTLAVEVQRTLNVDEDVIGRAEARSSSPGDAPAFAFDDAAHGRQIEVDRHESLHRVCGAGWRCDGSRRCLGYRQAKWATIGTTNIAEGWTPKHPTPLRGIPPRVSNLCA